MERAARRPLRVSILAILEGLEGIVLLIGLLALLTTITGADVSIGSWILAGVFLVTGLLSLLFSWGLWTLRRWAFWATVIIQVISLANSVLAFTQANANVAFIVVGMINPVLILLSFLFDSNVRAAFRT
jgi:uncharacterized membrane protein (DUF2068 family)